MSSTVPPGLRPTGAPLRVTVLVGVLGALLVGSAALAGVAAAIEDPTRPTGSVVHGPNCTDGFLRVAVTNGTEAHTLALTHDGALAGPATEVAAGAQTTLESTEVAWGLTVAVAVEVTGPAGAEEPLTLGTYTRPSEADCAAVTPPTGSEPTPPTAGPTPTTTAPPTTSPAPPTTPPPTATPTRPTPTTPGTTTPDTTTSGPSGTSTPPTGVPSPGTPSTGTPSTGTPSTGTPSTGAPSTGAPSPGTSSTGAPTAGGPVAGTVSSGQVSPGSVVTVRGTGFTPGEQVTVALGGVDAPLATVTADEQGRVEAVVQIPQDVLLGTATVQLLGRDSASSAAVDLQVAAIDTPEGRRTPWPLVVAGLALLVLAMGLAAAAARRPRRDDWTPPGTPG